MHGRSSVTDLAARRSISDDRAAFGAELERVRLLTLRALGRARPERAVPSIDDELEVCERALAACTRGTRGSRLAERLALDADELGFLWFAVALATDPLLGPHAVALGGSEARRGASLAFYATIADLPAGRARSLGLALGPSHPLFRFALLELVDGDHATALASLRAPRRLCRWLAGDDAVDDVVAAAGGLVALPDPVVPSDDHERARATLERTLAARNPALLVVEGPDGVGRRTTLARAARALGRDAVALDVRRLPTGRAVEAGLAALARECLLRDALPIVAGVDDLDGHEGEGAVRQAALARFVRELEVTAALVMSGGAAAFTSPLPSVRVTLAQPAAAVRRALWASEVDGEAGPLDAVAARYRLGAGSIIAAARAARAAATARDGRLASCDLVEGVRATIGDRFGALARRVETSAGWDDLVVADDIREQIDLVMARARHAYQVLETWGFGSRLARGGGLAVLLSGTPGTGKTMVAGLLARALELDLYQVDLSKVVSKWVGETEKNLSCVLDAAEAGHALLLFDEADALFARRSEVRGANDRYANLEVSHLLQRIEAFGGVAVLTTNLESSLDPALSRRLAAHIVFPKPGREERARLWERLLARRAPIAGDLDCDELAGAFPDLSGGHIRNAVVSAAFLAVTEGGVISQAHLERAAWNEYRAMGRLCFDRKGRPS